MTDIVQLTQGLSISCHCWNKDGSKIAYCPNNNTLVIAAKKGAKYETEHVLREHDALITGCDWAPESNRIVTCSEDRNAHVWTFDEESGQWKPEMVLLRINRACTDVKWSPNEDKFAVASSAKVICVCYFDEENDWWVAKHIKDHRSTVARIAWHPNNQLIASAGVDYRIRIFSAYIRDLDGKKPAEHGWHVEGADPKTEKPFDKPLVQFSVESWVHALCFSPSGDNLAFVCHASCMGICSAGYAEPMILNFKMLPMCDVLYVTESDIVCAGHDYQPYLFQLNGDDLKFVKSLDDKKGPQKVETRNKSFLMFQSMASKGTADASAIKTSVETRHQNAVTHIMPYIREGGVIKKFTTSALDGSVAFWNL